MADQVLVKLAYEAAKQAFDAARRALGDDEIVGYAILTHDTADSCQPIFATDRGVESFRFGSKQDFLFVPDNWDYDAHSQSFSALNKELQQRYDAGDYEVDVDWHAKFSRSVFDSCVDSLETLVREGYFEKLDCPNRPFVTLAVSDSDEMRTAAPGWVKRLNPKSVLDDFTHWHANTYSAK